MMNNERLSNNFTLDEFTRSDTLRDVLGVAIHVNSGYRCPELNKAVGGVPTSQHQKGEAADLSIDGKANDILEALENNNIPFDQAILYRRQNFLHVSLKLDGVQRSNVIIKM